MAFRCIFCEATTGRSKEHVFRKSLRKHFPEHDQIRLRSESDPSRNKIFKGSQFARTVPSVCAPCNNGWLNRIDEELEPTLLSLFRGDQTVLDRNDQRRLAYWAAVRAGVRGQDEVPSMIAAMTPFASRVYLDKRPPEGTFVWLGYTDAPLTLDGLEVWGVERTWRTGSRTHTFFQHTAALASALFVVVAPVEPAPVAWTNLVGASFEEVVKTSPFPLVKIWPRCRPTVWPSTPRIPFDVVEAELVHLSRRMNADLFQQAADRRR